MQTVLGHREKFPKKINKAFKAGTQTATMTYSYKAPLNNALKANHLAINMKQEKKKKKKENIGEKFIFIVFAIKNQFTVEWSKSNQIKCLFCLVIGSNKRHKYNSHNSNNSHNSPFIRHKKMEKSDLFHHFFYLE